MTTMMMSEEIAPEATLDEAPAFPPTSGFDLRRLMQAEPMAGLITLQFLRNLMDLNPALRRPVECGGLDELELWEALWTSVYAMPFDAMLTAGLTDGNSAPAADNGSITDAGAHAHGGSVIGEALLWTLESCFRDDFTPTARAAWETLYHFVKEAA